MNYIGREPSPGIEAGRLLQSVAHVRNDHVSLNGTIPQDDTIPQISEGVEFLTLPFTPQRVGSRVRVRVQFCYAPTAAATHCLALFKSDDVNAQACAFDARNSTDYPGTVVLEHEFTVAALTTLTWSMRAGTGGGNTLRLNGIGAGRLWGGTLRSFLRIEEYGQ